MPYCNLVKVCGDGIVRRNVTAVGRSDTGATVARLVVPVPGNAAVWCCVVEEGVAIFPLVSHG